MRRMFWTIAAVTTFTLAALPGRATADPIELKVSLFANATNPMNVEFARIADEIWDKSNGRLKLVLFHAGQMGPPPRQFDLVRTGVADMAYALIGLTPGRFPLTELVELPGVSPSGYASSMALREVFDEYLTKEYAGTKVLGFMVTPPVPIETINVPIRTMNDLKGLRIRHSGPSISAGLRAFGATPMAIQPSDVHEALGKGVLDGAAMAYAGAVSFKLQDVVKYVTDVPLGGVAFAVVMNQAAYDRLPQDLKKLIDAYATLKASQIGWAPANQLGEERDKELFLKAGVQNILLTDVANAEFVEAAAKVQESTVASLEKKGLPARAVIEKLKQAAAKYSR